MKTRDTDARTAPSPAPSRLERDAMAWPPGPWESEAGAWRTDVDYEAGTATFTPYAPDAAAPPATAPRRPAFGPMAREIFETVLLTALMFVGIRLVVQNFRIEGQSMEPTLYSDQYLLVNKLAYRLLGNPQRGDIVVFQAWGQDKDFIKRVVGLPGETVEIKDNNVYLNDEALDEPYLDGAPTRDTMHPVTLGEDQYYVLGDNRANSADSRAYGPLDAESIIGKAWLTYWPPENIGPIPNSLSSFASSASP